MNIFRRLLNNNYSLLTTILIAGVIILFLVPVPWGISNPWLSNFWNAGHLLGFFIISRCLAPYCQRFVPDFAFSITAIITLLMAGGIEIVQATINRQPSWNDFVLSSIGIFYGLLAFEPFKKRLIKNYLTLLATIITGGVYATFPFVALTIDKTLAETRVPLIIDFSTPFEHFRLSGTSNYERVTYPPNPNEKAVKVNFTTVPYSMLHIRGFTPNWSNYSALYIDTYLSGSTPLRVNISIEDQIHTQNGRPFNDRFTRVYQLNPGRNILTLLLDDIKKAPASRNMELSHIKRIALYTMNLEANRQIYLNKIQLIGP